MNVQSEKLRLIEWLIGLQDMATLKRLEELRRESEIVEYEASLRPMAVEEMIERAEESNKDIKAGRVYDIDDLIKEESDQ